jgi:hypothetical protein
MISAEDRRGGRMTVDEKTIRSIIRLVKKFIVGDVGLKTPKKSILPKVVGRIDHIHTGNRIGAMGKGNGRRAY